MDVWPEYRVKMLLKMHAGGMYASQIAKAMGVSRNAVIGKLDRLAVPRRAPSPPRRFSWETEL